MFNFENNVNPSSETKSDLTIGQIWSTTYSFNDCGIAFLNSILKKLLKIIRLFNMYCI